MSIIDTIKQRREKNFIKKFTSKKYNNIKILKMFKKSQNPKEFIEQSSKISMKIT
ncbi:MAG: hypothetical protein HFJ60_01755 [Clostridia bacterium]|jgi:hypothetical protein|nr:hypothetical protein [Clostridia bacterium]